MRSQSLLFDRLTTHPLVIAEGAMNDAEILTKGAPIEAVVFDITELAFVQRMLAPLDRWALDSYPCVVPVIDTDLWFEWFSPAHGTTFGLFVRAADMGAAIDGQLRDGYLICHHLVGGHAFMERPAQRDILHLGTFRYGVDREGRLFSGWAPSLTSNWDREFGEFGPEMIRALLSPHLFAMSVLHNPTTTVARHDPDDLYARRWVKKYKRSLASWYAIDTEPEFDTVSAEQTGAEPFPSALRRIQREPRAGIVDCLSRYNWRIDDIRVATQSFQGSEKPIVAPPSGTLLLPPAPARVVPIFLGGAPGHSQ
jgi:hypothetical protein